MPLYTPAGNPFTDFWKVAGHSWFQYQTGPSGDQTGRIDALFRSSMDTEHDNYFNYAIAGARAVAGTSSFIADGRSKGGWARALQGWPVSNRTGAPYAPDGGGTLLCFGINDLGVLNGHVALNRGAYINAMRAMVSRARASRIYYTTNAAFTYGAGFVSNPFGADGTQDPSGTNRNCHTTTGTPPASSTITYTIPADYAGEPIVMNFLQRYITYSGGGGGVPATGTNNAGTITFSGSAGITGTLYTGNGGPSGFIEWSYLAKRIMAAGTNNAGAALTSANAGQTIIMTCSSMDAGTSDVWFDGGWLETKTPPPVIICNIARSTTAGYNNSLYANWRADAVAFGGAGIALTDVQLDQDVTDTNTLLSALSLEFDSMVQVADCDTAIGKDATATSDGIHPNEKGAGPVVDAIIAARGQLTVPGTAVGKSLAQNGPAPRMGMFGGIRPRRVGDYATQEGILSYGTYTPIAQEMYAVPFVVSQARDNYSKIGIEVTTAPTVAGTIRLAVYDDVNRVGYPQQIMSGLDPTGTALSVATTPAGPSVREASFTLGWPADPGLYWLVLKVDTVGTGPVFRSVATGISPFMPTRPSNGISGIIAMGWKLTGVAVGALNSGALTTFPAGASPTATPPLIQVFRSK
jgi:lysophospholipase L1-like esterase